MMMNKAKYLMLAGMVAVMAGSGTALAAGYTNTALVEEGTATDQQVTVPGVEAEEKAAAVQWEGKRGGKGKHGDHAAHAAHAAKHAAQHQELLTFLGLTDEEFKAALEAEKSLLDIATEKGIAQEKLVDFLYEQHAKQLDQRVADGVMTQEHADEMKANFTKEKVAEMVASEGPIFKGIKEKGKPFAGDKAQLKEQRQAEQQELLTFFGLTEEEFKAAHEAQKSLLDIATEKGIAKEKLVEFVTAQHAKRTAQMVADGVLTQEQADKMNEKLAEHVEEMITGQGFKMKMKVKGPHTHAAN